MIEKDELFDSFDLILMQWSFWFVKISIDIKNLNLNLFCFDKFLKLNHEL